MPADGDRRIFVTAAAISHVARSRASGVHYSASGQYPFVVGVDGVGRLDDGRRVYFALPRAPHGSMAERTLVPSSHCLALPEDLDDVTAAAIANPGMSSWAAYTERARLTPGETVLVNGAAEAAHVRYYAVPQGAHPHDVAPAPDGGVWYTAQMQGTLGLLDPNTSKTINIPLGSDSAPHGVIVGPDRAAWVTDGGQNAIEKYLPESLAGGSEMCELEVLPSGESGLFSV